MVVFNYVCGANSGLFLIMVEDGFKNSGKIAVNCNKCTFCLFYYIGFLFVLSAVLIGFVGFFKVCLKCTFCF